MPIDIIGKLQAKNNGDFKLMDAKDVAYDNDRINTMIDKNKEIDNIGAAVDALIEILNQAPSLSYDEEDGFKEGQKKYWQVGDRMRLVFSFSSSASGKCDITITKNDFPFKSLRVNKGKIVVDLGVATSKETYTYTVTAIDSLGREANETLEFNHVIGGVDLSSTFDLTLQNSIFTVGTNTMEIPIIISYAESGYKRYINYVIKDANNKNIKSGRYDCGKSNLNSTISLENIEFKDPGEYSISLQGQVDVGEEKLYSNTISYNFAVIDENTIATSIIEFNNNNLTTNDYIRIKFRTITNISNLTSSNMLKSECKLYNKDNNLIKSNTFYITTGDVSEWTIGRQNEGTYTYEIIGKPIDSSTDGINLQYIRGDFEVTKTNNVGNDYVTENLIAYFDADDMDNSQDNPDIWVNKDGNYYFKLHGLNYEKNGWVGDGTGKGKMLKFTGDSYGELFHTVNGTSKPKEFGPMSLMNAGTLGNSFEIVYRTRCIGQMDACVISCRDELETNSPGYSIYYDGVKMSSDTTFTSTPITESNNEFVHVTFVIDKNKRDFKSGITNYDIENSNPVYTMNIYVNGVRTKVVAITDKDTFEKSKMQLLLNSYLNTKNDEITGFGSCEIKMIRIYNAALTAQEVLKNYINSKNDIGDREKLMAKNDPRQADIPIIHFVRNKTIKNSNGTTTNEFHKYSEDNTFEKLNSVTIKSSPNPNILTSKNTWVNCTMWYKYLDKESSTWKTTKYDDVDVYLQGTSTLQFPIKNYKIKVYNTTTDKQGKLTRGGKNKFIPPNKENEDGWLVPDSTYTLKCDYMEQSHKNNTPTAIMYEHILDGVIANSIKDDKYKLYSPCKRDDYEYAYDKIKNENGEVIRTRRKYRDAINGFPVLLYYNENDTDKDYNDKPEGDEYEDNDYDVMVGTMMFNIDKTGSSLGFNPKFKDFENVKSDKINNDGKIHVKNPKTGEPVKYTDGTDVLLDTIPCVSLEGSSNSAFPSAASFYTMDEANNYLYEDYLKKKYKEKQNDESYSNDYDTFYNEVQQKQYADIKTFEDYTLKPTDPSIYTSIYDYIKSTFDIRWAWTEESLESGKKLSDKDFNDCTYGHIAQALQWIDDSYNDEKKFKDEFNNYFNYEYCSTYFLQMMMFMQVDNAGKNAMFDKWFGGDIIDCGGIRPRPYDMDTQVGLTNEGQDTVSISAEINPILSPSGITGKLKGSAEASNMFTDKDHTRYDKYNTKNSKFWNAFAMYFKAELAKDYGKLRGIEEGYNIDWISNTVNSITSDIIGESFYNKDAGAKYMSQTYYSKENNILESERLILLNGNRDNRYRQVMQQRIIFTDTWFNYTGGNSINQPITLRANAPTSTAQIGISVYSPCYVKIDVGSSNDATIVAYIDPDSTYEYASNEYEGILFTLPTEAYDKEIKIYAAGNIKSINHMENLYLSEFTCGEAKKLTSINISSSTSLYTLATGANTYLRSLNVSNSTNLEGKIDLSNCENIQEINISNTNITTIELPTGSALKKFNAKNCKLTNIKFEDLQFLNDINLDGCNNISSYTIKNCPSVEEIDTTQYSNLKKIEISKCNKLSILNLSGSNINTLSITNCDSIKSINLSGANGSINNIDLTTLYKLETIDISRYNPRNGIIIRLPEYSNKEYASMTEEERENHENVHFNSLTTFIANDSNLKTVMRGSSGNDTNICDFSYLTLTEMNIENCTNITSIEKLNFKGNASGLFKGLNNLKNISGSITSTEDTIASMFSGCSKLSTIKNLKLSLNKVTNANDCFRRCNNIDYDSIKKLLDSIPNVTTINRFLYMDSGNNDDGNNNTNSPIDTLCSDLFENNTQIQSMEYAFRNTNITGVENILDYMGNTLSNIKGIFRNCINLQSVNNNIFKKCYKLSDCSEVFYSCTSLTTLFEDTYDIFAYDEKNKKNNNIVNTRMMFGKCGKLSENKKYKYKTGDKDNGLKLMFDHLPNLQYAEGMFINCTFITGIPTGLFEKNTNLMNICAMFQYNTKLKSIPNTLFTTKLSTNETTHSNLTMARGLFSDCTNLEGSSEGNISSNFFDGAFNIEDIGHINALEISNITIYAGGMFANTRISKCDAGFLDKLSNLKSVSMLFFKGSISVKTVNGKLVVNIMPSKDGNNNNTLQYIGINNTPYKICNSIFSKLRKLKDVRYCFAGNANITEFCDNEGNDILKPTLFDNCKGTLENAEGLFARTGLTCSVPEILFKDCSSLTTLRACYADCLLNHSLPNNFIEGCTSLIRTDYMFYNCKKLGDTDIDTNISIPVDIFKDCTSLINTSYMFAGCGFTGRIGTRRNTGNNGGLFAECSSLQTTEGMFAGCINLKGSIPEDIFYNKDVKKVFSELKNISHMFDTCTSLTSNSKDGTSVLGYNNSKIYGDGQDGFYYLIPTNWLDKCNNITNMSYIFNHVSHPNSDLTEFEFKDMVINNNTFSNQNSLENVEHAFAHVKHLSCEINNAFMKTSLNTITNASYMFAYSNIQSVGDNINNAIFETGDISKPNIKMQNMEGLLYKAYDNEMYGYAPTTTDVYFRKLNNNASGMVYHQTKLTNYNDCKDNEKYELSYKDTDGKYSSENYNILAII